MVYLLHRTIILFIVVDLSSSIRSEYYLDDEEQLDENDMKYIDDRTTNQYEESLPQSNNETFTSDSNYDEGEYNDDSLLKRRVMTETPQKKLLTKSNGSSATTISENNTSNFMTIVARMSNNNNLTSTTLNIHQAYEYVYDDDTKPLYERQQVDVDLTNTENTTSTTATRYDENVTQYDNNSIRYLADFYNLKPGVSKLHNIQHPIKNNNGSDYVWYVPEKYPCWELPIVYGRLGQRQVLTDVFRVYYGKLSNIVDVGSQEPAIPRKFLVPEVTKTVNKWCGVAPCFGDHTLCVFTDKKNSKICDKGYKVVTPTVLERISVVNTINSMRHSIANGAPGMYSHLPPAADMQQIMYDNDLETMAQVWLQQCLPGIDPCSSIDNYYVTQLECTKCAENCCVKFIGTDEEVECIPMYECFILPVVGCLHAWFAVAGQKLSETDVKCGHANPETFSTVQLIWAKTTKIGCAYGERPSGDVRIVCNFAPGAPFFIESKYFCGLISHRDITDGFFIGNSSQDITDLKFLDTLGIMMHEVKNINENGAEDEDEHNIDSNVNLARVLRTSDLDNLNEIYKAGWARQALQDYSNGTLGMIARLVTRYTFFEEGQSRCDLDEPIYEVGEPGSRCLERGRIYESLCYDFADPTPGYRLAAILAPIALFSLILYDLFGGVMRQTHY